MNRQPPYPRICPPRLAVSALLAVIVACGDGPTDVEAPVEARSAVQPQVSPETLTTVVLLLDDPFVRELMEGTAADAVSLYGAVRDASISRRTMDVLALSRELTRTRTGLFARVVDDGEGADADAEILRAALDLILEDAAMLLEQPPSTQKPDEGEVKWSRGFGTPTDRGASNHEE